MGRFLYQWGGGVVMAVAFLIGLADSFTATRGFVSWVSPLGVQPIHFAFWLLGIGAIYTTIIQGLRIRRIENTLPDIIVQPEIKNDRAILVVKNIGGEADFTAKARVIAANPQNELYTMYWESVRTLSCHIDGDGGIATILVGEKSKFDNKTTDRKTFYMKGNLILFKMGTSKEQVFPVFSSESIESIENGFKSISGRPIERCLIEVTITATPRFKKKWVTHRYLCEIENHNIKLCETDLSSPHKVSYQP